MYGYLKLVAVGSLLSRFHLVINSRSFISRITFAFHGVGMQLFDVT